MSQSGFTLLELLVVIALLAVVAGVAVLSNEGVQDLGRYDATQFEMTEIKKALLQFRRDSGTKSFPAENSYHCDTVWDDATSENIKDTNPWPTGAPAFTSPNSPSPAEVIAWKDWCQHPANFWMLFINPLDDITTTPIEENSWNPDTKRGWKGPYLQRKSGYLTLDSNQANLDDISQVWAIADPYTKQHLNLPEIDRGVDWYINLNEDPLTEAGSPYLLLVDASEARIQSMADDSRYEPATSDGCTPPVDNKNNPTDYVLCLLR